MADYDLVIRGGTVVTASDVVRADVGVRGGRIAALGQDLGKGERTLDADGLLVMPGGVDSHAHVEQLGAGDAVNADSFATGTASAAAGGTTSLVCFARQGPGEKLAAATADYHALARRGARVDYAMHLIITDPRPEVLDEIPALVEQGHRSLKIFMTYEGARLDDTQCLRVLAAARRAGALVCVHAEHHEMISWMTEQLLAAGLTRPKYHAWAKPILVERECAHRIIAMAELVDQPIQIFHVSGAEPAEEIARAQARGLKVWGETCTQYLVLTKDDLDRPGFEGAKYICSPALRTPADQEALWQHIRSGVIGNVTSDHSPNTFEGPRGKKVAGEDAPFTKVPNGVPGLAARLPILFSEGVAKGRIDLPTFVRITATHAAQLFGLYPKKGTIAPGADADLVLFEPTRRVRLTNALMHQGADYTPYEGMEVTGWPVTTLLRGQIVAQGHEILGQPGTGEFLPRGAYAMIRPLGRHVTPFDAVERKVLEG